MVRQPGPNDETPDSSGNKPTAGDGCSNGNFAHGGAARPIETDPIRVGPYSLGRKIGTGGMGDVFLGRRSDDQFHKTVAVKIVKRGMDTDQILRRFHQERQVLAALNHPNISRMLDGGMAEDGRPYFVMEYVEGMPIDKYCNNNRIGITQRLEYLQTLSRTVHYVHKNLIVHRDLKPSNVLITKDGELKLLDFGIAKLLNPDLGGVTYWATGNGAAPMTPEYASPEQVRGEPLTTGSDIYSLGVMMYELLTGRRPYRFKSRLPSEIERVVCKVYPVRPSTAVTREPEVVGEAAGTDSPDTGSTTVAEISHERDIAPSRLRREIAGDLDNIILMALRKEPHRRYESAEALAEDIENHATDHPVKARPSTVWYRAGRFVQRNKIGVTVALLFVMALSGGAMATRWQYNIAVSERANATRRFEQILSMSRTLFYDFHDKIKSRPDMLDTRELLVHYALENLGALETQAPDDIILAKEIAAGYERIGDIQGGLRSANRGLVTDALGSYAKAIAVLDRFQSPSPADQDLQRRKARVYVRIADLLQDTDTQTALQHANRAVDAIEVVDPRKRSLETRQLLVSAMIKVGDVHRKARNLEDAMQSYRRALAADGAVLNEREEVTANSTDNPILLQRFGEHHKDNNRHETALVFFNRLLAMRLDSALKDPTSVDAQRNLIWAKCWVALTMLKLKQYSEAQSILLDLRGDSDVAFRAGEVDARARFDYALMVYELGSAQFEIEDYASSLHEFDKAQEHLKILYDQDASHKRAYRYLALTHAMQGSAQKELGRVDDAIDNLKWAKDALTRSGNKADAKTIEEIGDEIAQLEERQR